MPDHNKTQMTIEVWPIERPSPYTRNAREIPQSAIDKVAASIDEFGWRQPIVVDEHDVIIAGHTGCSRRAYIRAFPSPPILGGIPLLIADYTVGVQNDA